LIIDDTGTVTLPPDVLLKVGGPGRFEIPINEKDKIHLERVEDEKIEINTNKPLILSPTCPACFHIYSELETQQCPDCGSSRPMIESNN
jgi:rubrerythrin